MSTPLARLIACEPEPHIAPLLRRFLPKYPLAEARSPALLHDLLIASPVSFVVVYLTAEEGHKLLATIADGVREFPRTNWAAYGEQKIVRFQRPLQQAGVQFVVHSLTQLPQLRKMVRRHFSRIVEPELPLLAAMQAKLPWSPK